MIKALLVWNDWVDMHERCEFCKMKRVSYCACGVKLGEGENSNDVYVCVCAMKVKDKKNKRTNAVTGNYVFVREWGMRGVFVDGRKRGAFARDKAFTAANPFPEDFQTRRRPFHLNLLRAILHCANRHKSFVESP
jgi:hypothetical protein